VCELMKSVFCFSRVVEGCGSSSCGLGASLRMLGVSMGVLGVPGSELAGVSSIPGGQGPQERLCNIVLGQKGASARPWVGIKSAGG
jgi:hypothetical protein